MRISYKGLSDRQKELLKKQIIETFKEGPILPEEVPKKEYDNVINYLISCGFIESVLEGLIKEYEEEEETLIGAMQ